MQKLLEALRGQMLHLQAQPGIGAKCLGVAEFDNKLRQIGLDWLAAHAEEVATAGQNGDPGQDVYLATQLYEYGGHTALIGDFTRALAVPGKEPYLIITDILSLNPSPLPPEIQSRLGVKTENIFVLTGSSLDERLEQLFQKLLSLRPRRLFLFHHSHDPLPAVVCQPEIVPQCVLVHHADSIPSFGLFLPALQIIDLNSTAAATTRLLGLTSKILLPTAPDPGPRPGGFLQKANLITATSGPPAKFTRLHTYSYPETVGVILKSTGGWHLHAGRLSEETLSDIEQVLIRQNISPDRFKHFTWVPSLSAFLWAEQCDLYFSSFPVDGARTNAEVLASATPHLRFSVRPTSGISGNAGQIPGGLIWSSWEDLADTLRGVSDGTILEDLSKKMRTNYEILHHPRVFADTLQKILDRAETGEEPLAAERDKMILRSMMKTAIQTLQFSWLDTKSSPLAKYLRKMEKKMAGYFSTNEAANLALAGELEEQRDRTRILQDQLEKMAVKVAKLELENKKRERNKTFRGRILRWRTKS